MARRSRTRLRRKRPTPPVRAAHPRPWRRARAKATVVIVGFGRLGGTLARALRAAGFSVAVAARSEASSQRARREGLPLPDGTAWSRATVCFLCVPDRELGEAVRALPAELNPRAGVVHCAGALSLDVLGDAGGRPRGSFHPLAAVSSPHEILAGRAVALAASDERLSRALRSLGRRHASLTGAALAAASAPDDRS